MKILDRINKPKDIKKLSLKDKEQLAKELREYTLDVVSKNGGHLASNLGIVELTIALLSIYNVPKDKIVFDVGHQSYIYKILTDRKEEFKTIRTNNGISGFPKINESIYDSFGTGHSSTSISAALGMARARDLKHESNSVIAVIGDGALTGGMALEALNDCGASNTNITVILNDNEMSISKNVGGISECLGRVRSSKVHINSNNFIKRILSKTKLGRGLVHFIRKIKHSIKQLFISNMFFEDIGFTYLGPIDGHDIEKIESMLKISKKIQGPVLLHIVTKKGKGYKIAEEHPDKFHGVSPFDIETGLPLKEKKDDYSSIFGKKLVELAKKDKKIVAVCAAMKSGTGLSNFADTYPDRFFDVGIAEQHALTMAAGLAKEGLKPVVSIYSSFYQRAYDQVIHDIASQNLPVVMCVDRAGLVGQDGETHQGLFDLSFFSIIPNLVIIAPKDFKELEESLEYALSLNKPVVIRYPRGGENYSFSKHSIFSLGKSEVLSTGSDVTIIGIGKMTGTAMEVREILNDNGIKSEVINARFLKPLDDNTILKSIKKTKNVITIEDNILEGGLATKVKELIVEHNLDIKVLSFGYPDEFIKHGNSLDVEKKYKVDALSIANKFMNK